MAAKLCIVAVAFWTLLVAWCFLPAIIQSPDKLSVLMLGLFFWSIPTLLLFILATLLEKQ